MQNYTREAFTIEGGWKRFYQWDLNQKIKVNDPAINEVHFCNGTSDCSLVCIVKDGQADVPNALLQTAGNVRVYGYSGDHTVVEKVYEVKARTKPEDYVYTETEVLRYENLEKRIKALEDKQNDYEAALTNANALADEIINEQNGYIEGGETNDA